MSPLIASLTNSDERGGQVREAQATTPPRRPRATPWWRGTTFTSIHFCGGQSPVRRHGSHVARDGGTGSFRVSLRIHRDPISASAAVKLKSAIIDVFSPLQSTSTCNK